MLATGAALAPQASAAPRGEAFPAREDIRAARDFVRSRDGVVGFAVIDTRGRLRGIDMGRPFVTASVVKAMLLVSYLRKVGNRAPNAEERGVLGPMITVSDNGRASDIYGRVGDAALERLAKRVKMRHFSIAGSWANARFSAADQARFMLRFDRMVPPRSRAYARRLLSSIVAWQRWGFSRYSLGAGWRTFFKGGWRSTGHGKLVHEVALFQRGKRRISMAVLTDGNPSHSYGAATLRGVAARIFGRGRRSLAAAQREEAGSPAHARAGLVDVHRFAPKLRLDLRYRTRRNLTGRRLPGYCRNWALLGSSAARDLGRVERYLNRRGRALEILDAYRPARASRALVDWARRTGRGHLVGSYIAERSNHNKGSAVDLRIVRRRDGKPLRMGTGYDDLSTRASTLNARGRILRNRLSLVRAMERFGWRNYRREWWHFDHRSGGSRYLDLPLGCED